MPITGKNISVAPSGIPDRPILRFALLALVRVAGPMLRIKEKRIEGMSCNTLRIIRQSFGFFP